MKLKVGLFFGGRSTEHEVSVITALQAYKNLDQSKYEIIPIYVSKGGQFYSDPRFLELKNYQSLDQLLLSVPQSIPSEKDKKGGLTVSKFLPKFTPIDVALPLFHGSFGEDGCIQGVFETYQIPYAGLNVTGSAIGMDKIASKYLFIGLGFKVADWIAVKRNDWNADQSKILKEIQANLKYPVFVKPATIGSSIGAAKASSEDELQFNLEVAFAYSDKAIVEACFEGKIEVNCSARGYRNIEASVCEMPVSSGELLSFEDKYQRGGGKGTKGAGMASLSRVIPAPISPKLTKEIQEATVRIFKALDGCGVARVDYFVDKENETFWVNEVNSPPGSLSFYLWEPTGVKFKELLDGMIRDALDRSEDQRKTQYTFDSGLLQQMALEGGIKGG